MKTNLLFKSPYNQFVCEFNDTSIYYHYLFTYEIINNPFCPTCADSVETLVHFFLHCPSYTVQRALLVSDLHCILNSVPGDESILDLSCDNSVIQVVTTGLHTGTNYPILKAINDEIFSCVSRYICSQKDLR